MTYSFPKFIENRFQNEITEAARECLNADNVREIPAKVSGVRIWQIDTNVLLRYEDYAELPIIVSVNISSEEDGRRYNQSVYMRGSFSGTFSQGFDDFKIRLTQIIRQKPVKVKSKFYDDLLMKLSDHEIQEQVNRLLFKQYAYNYADKHPMLIDPIAIAKQLGIRIFYAPLEENCRGAYVMSDTKIKVYNHNQDAWIERFIPANTILVNMAIKGNWEAVRFTIMHELIHAYMQRYALWLRMMCIHDFHDFQCPVRQYEDYRFLDDFLERAERQADLMASYALMPAEAFKKKAKEILERSGAWITPESVKAAVDKTAQFFCVSTSAARRRMLELGFEQAKGVYNYIDGGYVPPFTFSKGSLEKDETFVISAKQLQEVLTQDKKVMKLFVKCRICFVENHLVLNSPQYIEGKGKYAHLTGYAREHMEECAFKFRMVFPDEHFSDSSYDTGDAVVYRTQCSRQEVSVIMTDPKISEEERIRILADRTEDITSIAKQIGRDFPSAMSAVVAWSDMEKGEIAHDAWIDDKTLYKLCHSDEERPTLKIMVRLCVAMQLPMEISILLVEASQCGTRATLTDMGFIQFLAMPSLYTVKLINEILAAQGRQTLGGHDPDRNRDE